jgi:hypothetical protein
MPFDLVVLLGPQGQRTHAAIAVGIRRATSVPTRRALSMWVREAFTENKGPRLQAFS